MGRGFFFEGQALLRWFIIVLLLTVLVSCAKTPSEFIGVEQAPVRLGGGVQLIDPAGQTHTLGDYRGKVVVLFFGYTHCPDVCPTTLAELARAMLLLGPQRSKIQVLFVTLDPQRDTREVMGKYVPSFSPDFVGLTGNQAETDALAKQFKVFYQKKPEQGRSGYVIDHDAGLFVLDKTGRYRVYINYGQKPVDIAHDLRLLIEEN
jgi:protein SCO1/2